MNNSQPRFLIIPANGLASDLDRAEFLPSQDTQTPEGAEAIVARRVREDSDHEPFAIYRLHAIIKPRRVEIEVELAAPTTPEINP